nr:MAG TPA: Transcriptional regulator, LacI family regulator, Lacl family, Protein.33A [Caudoviricetes sp.]
MKTRSPVQVQPYMQEDWFAALKDEAERSSLRRLGEKLGYSKTALSMILRGTYYGKTDKAAAAVRRALLRYTCPHSGETMSATACRTIAHAPPPTHNPIKMQHWRSCQKCEIRPCEKRKRPSEK